MLPGYITVLIIVVVIFYVSGNQNSQFAATASAIRQVWSGGCRLSCRQSAYSGFSGLSGLQPATNVISYPAGPAQSCVCESCPCALIEKVLRTLYPAAQMYTSAADTIQYFFFNLIKAITETYQHLFRVFACGASCQRYVQLTTTNDDEASETFNFSGHETPSSEESTCSKPTKKFASLRNITSKLSLLAKKSNVGVKDESDKSKAVTGESKKSVTVKKGMSEDTLKPSTSAVGTCPKCVKSGHLCLRGCPKAKK